MTVTATSSPRPRPRSRGRSALLQGTRVLLGAFGAVKLGATAWFLFWATAEQGGDPEGIGDWSVGIWSAALAVALLVAAVRLGRDRRVVPVLVGVLLVDLVFGAVKLTVYDEPEAVLFMAVDVVLVGLLALVNRRRAA